MRYVATSLLLACFMCTSSLVEVALADPEHADLTPPQSAEVRAYITEQQMKFGVLEETPNQRRIRLGQPIEMSYPPPDYGELLETPNQRRARLASEKDTRRARVR